MRTLLSTDRHRMHSTGISPLIVTGFEGGVVGDYSTYTSFEYPIYLEAQGWSDLRVRFHCPERHRNSAVSRRTLTLCTMRQAIEKCSLFAVIVEDAFMDRKLCLRTVCECQFTSRYIIKSQGKPYAPEISNTFTHHPAIDKKNCSVGLNRRVRLFVEHKTDRNIDLRWHFQVEGRDEEPDSSCSTWQAFGDVPRSPLGYVETWKMPSLPLSEEPSLI